MSNQLPYVNDLGKVSTVATANLSSVVKEQMFQSHDQVLNIAKDMFWLNATFHTENTMFSVIRQLEFDALDPTDRWIV